MSLGTIKIVIIGRGFGFILPDGKSVAGADLVFERSDVPRPTAFDQLHAGQRVEYDLGYDERRGTPKATKVRSVSE